MSEESQLGPAHDGSVMIDIGGEMGALVIMTLKDLAGHEFEISANSPEAPRTHVAVRERLARGGPSRYAAVFPSLHEGDYTIWRHKGHAEPLVGVTIHGGQVTELDWS